MILDFIVFSIFFSIYMVYVNHLKNKSNNSDKNKKWVLERLEELKNKKNKDEHEQLEYINLHNSMVKGININYTLFIKIIILIILMNLLGSYLLLFGLIMGWLIISRILKIKKDNLKFFIGFSKDFVSITAMIVFFRMIGEYNVLLIFLNIFILSFIYNLWRNRHGKIGKING